MRGSLDDQRLPAQTNQVSSEQHHRTRHTALGCIPGATSSRWDLLQLLRRIILPMASGEHSWDAGTALSSAGSLVLHPLHLPLPARFLSQRLNAAWIYQRLARTCTAVVSALCRSVSLPAGSGPAFMQPVHLSPSGSADEERRLAFRPPVTFLRGFTSSFLEAGCFASFLSRKRQRGCQTLTVRIRRPLLALCAAFRH